MGRGHGQEASAGRILPKSVFGRGGAGNTRLFERCPQGCDLRPQANQHGNVARGQRSVKFVRLGAAQMLVKQGVGRRAEQGLHAASNPADLCLLVRGRKKAQLGAELPRRREWPALSLVVQQAARHVQHVLAGTKTAAKTKDRQIGPDGTQAAFTLPRYASKAIDGLIRVANAKKTLAVAGQQTA